jgi:hypothetical protein
MADNIFVYLGGEQEVPADVTHVIIDRSVKIIPERAFYQRMNMVSVETHGGLEKIEKGAFQGCHSLRGIKLPGVKEVGYIAFINCIRLMDVEFGDKLETIEEYAFACCPLRRSIVILPIVRTIGERVFGYCKQLTDVELPAVERIEQFAFIRCPRLRRIAIPLKDNLFAFDTIHQRYNQFDECENLTTVDLVGGIHKTIASLLLESWKDEIYQEIDRINQVLPNTPVDEKTAVIQEWIESVINRMEHYKAEHYALLKKDMTLLELALWKAKLDESDASEEDTPNGKAVRNIDVESVRKELRVVSGADIIIKNVLPFLKLG